LVETLLEEECASNSSPEACSCSAAALLNEAAHRPLPPASTRLMAGRPVLSFAGVQYVLDLVPTLSGRHCPSLSPRRSDCAGPALHRRWLVDADEVGGSNLLGAVSAPSPSESAPSITLLGLSGMQSFLRSRSICMWSSCFNCHRVLIEVCENDTKGSSRGHTQADSVAHTTPSA